MGEAALELKKVSAEQYLRDEEARQTRHEFVGGWVFALAETTDRLNRITTNISGQFWLVTRGGVHQVYASAMKLRVEVGSSTHFYYPDVMVTKSDNSAGERYKVAPVLLAEVTTVATEGTARREKLSAYQRIPELLDYLIVSADEHYVERYRRDADGGWWVHEYRDDGVVKLPDLQLELTLADIYEGL